MNPPSSGDVLATHIGRQVEVMLDQQAGALRGDADAVHAMRIATRRLRSTLATFRPLLHVEVTEPARVELKWLGRVLGQAREAEVLGRRLNAAVEAIAEDLVMGPVSVRVSIDVQARQEAAAYAMAQELAGPRYRALLDRLSDLLGPRPLGDDADRPAEVVLPHLVGRAARRVDRAAADVPSGGDGRAVALHEVRKAAKRARYAAEVARPVAGRPAKRLASRMKAVQEVLGEHQDTIDARVALWQMAIAAHHSGEIAFTYGLLHAGEAVVAEAALRKYPATLAAASGRDVRTWTN